MMVVLGLSHVFFSFLFFLVKLLGSWNYLVIDFVCPSNLSSHL